MYSSDPFSSTPSDGCCSPISGSSGFLSSSTKMSSVEETRALKLAFELTMAGASTQHFFSPPQDTSSVDEKFNNNNNKKSQNMTECVPVPSSEHVAEIVGRQGCKIKALRAKTNTYIKTPVRGEEPVFVVTGRKEDVGKAKREIISAAEHFSLIRASRKPAIIQSNNYSSLQPNFSPVRPQNIQQTNGSTSTTSSYSQPCNKLLSSPGQTTIQVRVPYRVVGLVVGPKGATIKNIQNETQTYIVTPSRDKEPVFEVTGSLDSVREAKRQIEGHIALRTGSGSFCMREENEPDHDGRFCGGSGSELVNIWKNIICEDSAVDLPIQNTKNTNDIVVIDSSSSGCSSSASTTSSSSSEKLKYNMNQKKKNECVLCGAETDSVSVSSITVNNSENNLILCLECATQVRSGSENGDSPKYRYMIS